MTPIGPTIRELREDKGLQMRTLARRTGVHERTIGDIERGVREPSERILAKLCRGLKTEPAMLRARHEAKEAA